MGLAPLPEPEPEPQESAEVKAARQRSERLFHLTDGTATAEWSEAQVSEWVSLIDLPDACLEAVQAVFSDMDGEEVVGLTLKMLLRLLRLVGVSEPGPVAATILRQRHEEPGRREKAVLAEIQAALDDLKARRGTFASNKLYLAERQEVHEVYADDIDNAHKQDQEETARRTSGNEAKG